MLLSQIAFGGLKGGHRVVFGRAFPTTFGRQYEGKKFLSFRPPAKALGSRANRHNDKAKEGGPSPLPAVRKAEEGRRLDPDCSPDVFEKEAEILGGLLIPPGDGDWMGAFGPDEFLRAAKLLGARSSNFGAAAPRGNCRPLIYLGSRRFKS